MCKRGRTAVYLHSDGAAEHWDWLRQTQRAIIPTQNQPMEETPIGIYKKGNGSRERDGGNEHAEAATADNQGTWGS